MGKERGSSITSKQRALSIEMIGNKIQRNENEKRIKKIIQPSLFEDHAVVCAILQAFSRTNHFHLQLS